MDDDLLLLGVSATEVWPAGFSHLNITWMFEVVQDGVIWPIKTVQKSMYFSVLPYS